MSVLDLALAALEMEPRDVAVPWTREQAILRARARRALELAKREGPKIVRLRRVASLEPCDGCSRVGWHCTWCPVAP